MSAAIGFQIFLFLIFIYVFGFVSGSTHCFQDFYTVWKEEREDEKRKERVFMWNFRTLPYDAKKLLAEINNKGYVFVVDSEFNDGILHSDTFPEYVTRYLEYETWPEDKIKVTLNKQTTETLKKHPELLDVVK